MGSDRKTADASGGMTRAVGRWLGGFAIVAVVLTCNEVRLTHPIGEARADVYLRAMNAVKTGQQKGPRAIAQHRVAQQNIAAWRR